MIAIRTDANSTIAMGHLMRCMSVAKQLRKLKQTVIFIISENDSKKYIEDNGFECVCLNNRYSDKEKEIDGAMEADRLRELVEKYDIDKMIVDSYQVTHRYLTAIKKMVHLIYIDDINAFKYPADILINYGYHAGMSMYSRREYDISEVKLLLGSDYVPLREEFAGNAIEIKERAESLFITTGGTDEFDMITGIIEAVNRSECRDMRKNIVAGKFYKYIDKLQDLQQKDKLIEVNVDIPNIYDIMRKSDIAVSAGGTTLAELCACGVPTVCFSVADNQLEGVKAYSEAGFMHYAGDVRNGRNDVLDGIVCSVRKLREDYEGRETMAGRAKMAIDGKGALRIARAIVEL